MKRTSAISAGLNRDDHAAAIKEAAAVWKTRADAGLNQQEAGELQAWIEADPRHRAALARFDSIWEKFDRPFQAGVTEQLLEALQLRARRRRRQVVATVSGVLVLLSVGSAWRFGGGTGGGSQERSVARAALPASAVLLMPARQTLPDGTIVHLKEGAEIALDFSSTSRRVELRRGEAHFQVTKEANRGFVVVAGGVEARALGTAFDVQVGKAAVEVLVTEGQVSVISAASPQSAGAAKTPSSIAVLGVSDRIVVDRASSTLPPQVISMPAAELDERLAWRAPQVEFTRTSLAEAVAVLNRYSAERRSAARPATHFIIADPAIASVRVSGLFRIDDGTDAFVGLLREGFGIDAEPRGGGEILLKVSAVQKPN